MACPFFLPSSRSSTGAGPQNSTLPLGDSWAGVCRAVPDSPWQPDPAVARPLCNLGYARGRCERFPGGDAPDAVRFTVSADDGRSVRLYYVIERDHHPFAHGPLEYATDSASCTPLPGAELLETQARAYLTSYLRRKSEATAC